MVWRLQDERVERARRLDRRKMGVGQLEGCKRLFREAVPGLGERQRYQVGHLLIGLQKKGDRVLSLAGSSLRARTLSAASSWSSTALTALSGSAFLPCRSIASR